MSWDVRARLGVEIYICAVISAWENMLVDGDLQNV